MHAALYQGASGPLGETITLRQATRNGVASHDFGPYGTAYRLAAI